MSLLLVSLLGRGVPCTRRSNYKLLHYVGRFLAASSSGTSAANLQSSHITAPAISVVVHQRYLHTLRRQPLSPLYRTGSRLAMSTTTNATTVVGDSEGPQRRVLSIQSHVVHGYVGNKSASFPLQVLGFEVDAINSVQFSNHTGYKHIKGQVLDDTQLDDLVTGLELNNLLNVYSHLLTGYIGQDAFLRKVVDTVKKLRAQNPNLVYVCDPVMGDDGHMYVPANLLPIYRDEIIPLADICTPNQFEVELLTGERIASESDAWQAMQWFHERGVRTVALSSTDLGATGELLAFVSHRSGADDAKPLRLTMRIPKQGNGVVFTGTGDLFASLFLAHSTLQPNVKGAFESTVATLQAVIANTVARMPAGLVKVESRHRELKIVQSKCDIERPTVKLSASEV